MLTWLGKSHYSQTAHWYAWLCVREVINTRIAYAGRIIVPLVWLYATNHISFFFFFYIFSLKWSKEKKSSLSSSSLISIGWFCWSVGRSYISIVLCIRASNWYIKTNEYTLCAIDNIILWIVEYLGRVS